MVIVIALEIAGLLVKDYLDNKILIRGKGNKNKKFALRPEVCELINEYLQTRNSNSEFFFYAKGHKNGITGNAVFDRILKIGKLAGIPEEKLAKIGAHSLRRNFITKVVKQYGVAIGSKLARHSSWKTTQRYVIVDEEEINEALLNQNAVYFKEN